MNAYEARAVAAEQLHVNIVELSLQCEGFCCENYIFINRGLTYKEKNCILAEEIAHYLYTAGDITDQNDTAKRKAELFARRKAYEEIVPFENVVSLLRAGEQIYDIAELYDLPEQYLREALGWYVTQNEKIMNCSYYEGGYHENF